MRKVRRIPVPTVVFALVLQFALLASMIDAPLVQSGPFLPPQEELQTSAFVSGNTRGVTLFYLDGASQDFPWILANLNDPTTQAKLVNLLLAYRDAGVNWIRLLVVADHFKTASTSSYYPYDVSNYNPQPLIDKLNQFMAITRNLPTAPTNPFTIEIVLGTPMDATGYFADSASLGYPRDRRWFYDIVKGLNFSNLGMILISGDTSPCEYLDSQSSQVYCYGDAGFRPRAYNHGSWLLYMWRWFRATFPSINASFEVVTSPDPGVVTPGNARNWELLRRTAVWVNTYASDSTVVAGTLYFRFLPASNYTAADYKAETLRALQAFQNAGTGKTLWIDEFGQYNSLDPNYSDQAQAAYYQGVLDALACGTSNKYPQFAWSANYDGPQISPANGFGLFSGYDGANQPIARQAWTVLSTYYNKQSCP
jgi:hypothetical protein